MRENIICYVNGTRHELTGDHAFMTMSDYLRYLKNLTGTKVVCAEGDCGACTVLVARMLQHKFTNYISINSCIAKMYLYDRCHIITVEGLGNSQNLHPVQKAFVDEHGAQCGYCTPGFICATAGMVNDLKLSGKNRDKKKVKNYLTGNLCRCTGYEPIINAGMKVNLNQTKPLAELYNDGEILEDFKKLGSSAIRITSETQEVELPLDFAEASKIKAAGDMKLISGATDLGVVDNKGKLQLKKTLCLNNLEQAYQITETDTHFEIGAKVTLSECEKALEQEFPEFVKNLHIFASPQIKNAGTLVGNVVNASPIADTIPFLMVNEAMMVLVSSDGERKLNVNDFFKGGYKDLDLKENEMVKSIILPKSAHQYKLYKVSIRRDLDISSVTFAARYKIDDKKLTDIHFAFGGVGPIVLRTKKLEAEARGKIVEPNLFKALASQVSNEVTPLSDHRGSDQFRYQICHNLLLKFGDEIIQEHDLGFTEANI